MLMNTYEVMLGWSLGTRWYDTKFPSRLMLNWSVGDREGAIHFDVAGGSAVVGERAERGGLRSEE